MASSNPRRSSEGIPFIAVALSVVFLLIMIITILWVVRPAALGYNNARYTDNPTQIAIPGP